MSQYSAFLQNGNRDVRTMPPFNVDLAKLWIKDCLGSHNQCRLGSTPTGTYPLPSRLICVKGPRSPLLIETASKPPVTYVALSYCWGTKGQTQTLKENYQKHLAGIPFDTLSKTSKDAVQITRHLGYDYLWIDALCMIQDDTKDKHREMDRMGDIYRYAVLTICAEGSEGAQVGVLPSTPADPREVHPCTITLAPKTASSGSEPVSRRLTVAVTRNPKNFLARRGWTLQEEALSSRALVLGQGLLAWRCACATASETDPVPRPLPADPYADGDEDPGFEAASVSFAPARPSVDIARMRLWLYAPRRAEKAAASALLNAPGARRGRKPAFAAWYTLIQGYSNRDLTNVADTLPAVGGLAAVLEASLGKPASYLKGLWAEDLHRGLLWYVSTNDDRQVRGPKTTNGEKSNAAIKAPSWSWAAVGKVRVGFCSLRFVKWCAPRDLGTASFDDDDDETSPVSGNDGQPSIWPLRLNAPTRRLRLKIDTEYASWRLARPYRKPGASHSRFEGLGIATEGVHPRFAALLCDSQSPMEVVGEAALDGDSEPTDGSGAEASNVERWVSCVALQEWELQSKTRWACLILEAIGPDAAEYKRIGVGFIFEGACFANVNDHDQSCTGYQQHTVL